ncbi:MAG: tripartite tricarboxylate transporter substrate binding protein [Betaproteobacteria bacterium]|nr:tripartite tricarboxylate transporter substrate binding protein [Betaproteobacteria bacterium]
MRTLKLLTAIAIPAVLAVPAAHAAQPGYPEKPIRFVIGSAPGSGPDIIARVLAERLYGAWGQRVVVDSRPGVAGILSADLVLRSAPDGYTWMMLTSQLLVATAVYPNVKFNLGKDFASISLIGTVPFVLAVNPELPAKSIRELIELAKKTPGALQYGSAGTGATEHLSGVLFTRLTGTNMLHVPYKGIAEALAATMGKEVHLTYAVLPAALSIVKSGRVRALAVTSLKRAALLPDVPTISETVPGYQTHGWYSVVAPTGTPPAVLAKVSAEVVKAVKEPQFGEQLKALGLDLVGSSRAELDAFRRDQTKRINEIVKASGVDVK